MPTERVDHFERFNRAIYKFNTALDHAILRPVARGYVKVMPQPVRNGVSNFLGNLEYTKTIGNDVLQAHFVDFGNSGDYVCEPSVKRGFHVKSIVRVGGERVRSDNGHDEDRCPYQSGRRRITAQPKRNANIGEQQK